MMMEVLYVHEGRSFDKVESLATSESDKLGLEIGVEGAMYVAQNF